MGPRGACWLLLLGEGRALSVWQWARMDYSAANEYVEAHYGQRFFFGDDVAVEAICNAREWGGASLEGCGFELVQVDEPTADTARSAIAAAVEGTASQVVLWHPQHRSEAPGEGESSIATAVHIDTDLNAMSAEDVGRLVENNCVSRTSGLASEIAAGRRFAIVNAWRNADSKPIARAPLALLATSPNSGRFPTDSPDRSQRRWYTFPAMTGDEWLLFKQYDRSLARTSDVWHCALAAVGDAAAPPRRSFEIRAFVLFDEVVPEDLDRFAGGAESRLSYEASACFCGEQAAARRRLPRKA